MRKYVIEKGVEINMSINGPFDAQAIIAMNILICKQLI